MVESCTIRFDTCEQPPIFDHRRQWSAASLRHTTASVVTRYIAKAVSQIFLVCSLQGLVIATVHGNGEALAGLTLAPQGIELSADSVPVRLLLSQQTDDGKSVDRTTDATYRSLDPSIVSVDSDGRVEAVSDGTTSVVATYNGMDIQTTITSVHCSETPSPDFATEVQPILAAAGCSTGPCHGKQGGQNGFQLSLLGFDDDFDYDAIAKQSRARRVSFASPKNSLLITKATASRPHGGGKRFDDQHPFYEKLLDWLESGAPRTGPDATSLESISIEPKELFLAPNQTHRLVVTATFADRSRRDVTHLTAFSSNESAVAAVEDQAIVRAGPIAGEAAIMARFMGQIGVCQVFLPRPDQVDASVYTVLPRNNVIDGHVWDKLQQLNIVPSQPADDARFLRRIYLDIVGRQPPEDAVRDFLADTTSDKRIRRIDDLLADPRYADHWANKWVDLLRPNPYRVGIKAVMNLDNFVRQSFRENKPYDLFVRELVTAQGSTWHNGASTLFRDRRTPEEITTMFSQLFLGVRLECAKCHHHPFEVWGQDDFFSFAAFFARVGRKGTGLSPPISGGEEIVYVKDSGSVSHPRTNKTLSPRVLDATRDRTTPEVAPGETPNDDESSDADPRLRLADWMTNDTNPYFSKVIANRVWADLMGRGVVDPVDDIRATNPASNEGLLNALAQHLRDNDFDLKSLIRLITSSHVYALSTAPNETNRADYRNYSRYYRQRLRAEVLLDAINQITDSTESFAALPADSRANELWTHRIPSLFLDTFSRPDLNQDPPCERVSETAVVQALHLMNSPKLHAKVTGNDGFAAGLAKSDTSPAEIVDRLYLRVYARYPDTDEKRVGTEWIKDATSRRAAIEDLLWSLLNSAEFVFKD